MQLRSVSRLERLFEWAVNICLICVSCLLMVFCWAYLKDRSSAASNEAHTAHNLLRKGETLNIEQIRKANPNGRLLLIALQSGCKFCKESIPLYKSLLQHSEVLNAKLVFLFAEPMPVALTYFQENDIKADNIAHAEFSSINVTGTPTMILIDPQNKIIDFWVGKIEGDRLSAFHKELDAQHQE